MKKRSLFSAVAMLIVSAIVLTSATYAWFAQGTTVSVDTVSATVSNSDGSILISADGQNWKAALTQSDLEAQAANSIASAFTPVSFNPANENIVAGSITGGVFTAATATAGTYIKYTCYVKSDVDVTANVNPNFAPGTSFIYAYIKTANDATLRGTGKYYPIVNANGTATDANGNNIVDDSTHDAYTINTLGTPASFDTDIAEGLLAASAVEPDADALTIDLVAGQSQTIVVYMWAEGQNTACTGTVAAATSSIGLTITKA